MKRATQHLGRLALLLTAAAQPWCEAGAGAHARAQLAPRGGAAFTAWDVDATGLHLWGASATVAGRRVAAEHVSVALGGEGLEVRVHGLALGPATADDDAPAPSPAAAREPAIAGGRDRFRVRNRGVAVTVIADGTLQLELPHGAALTITDPSVAIDREGWPTLRAAAALSHAELPTLTIDDLEVERHEGRWDVRAVATVGDGAPLHVDSVVEDAARRLTVRDGAQRALTVSHRPGDAMLRVEGEAFPLAYLGAPVLAAARSRGIGLEDATLGGAFELSHSAPWQLHADGMVIDGLVLDDRRLSGRPIRFDALSVDGDAALAERRVELQLVLGHHDARIAVGGHVDADQVTLDLDLAELSCDALLAAMPAGTADALVGARLDGSIAASAQLSLSLATLSEVRRKGLDQVPGQLALAFPFLERCRTVADPANVDLAALRGPYRHRFVDDDGRLHERVLAPGAAEFVPLGRVPRIASAFIALEDMHYWYHDGFDREQIERAFWHNVVSGRVRRGASTISQQTARNLWLGIDRSLSRKLQEAYLTSRLESVVSKTRILELYVNLIELGPGIYGVDAASRFYFGVPAEELDALQAVHLAQLAPAPRALAKKWQRGQVDAAWLAELRDHVRRMHRNRMVSDAELRAALRGELGLLDRSR